MIPRAFPDTLGTGPMVDVGATGLAHRRGGWNARTILSALSLPEDERPQAGVNSG
jgi:hypothetical protein